MIRISAPARLHFGLLALGQSHARQFGGLGLMIDSHRTELEVAPAESFHAQGPGADRVIAVAERFAHMLPSICPDAPTIRGASIRVLQMPAAHCGFGSGTALAMAVAHGLASLYDVGELTASQLAILAGRGKRSAVGVHGSMLGGLLVEGGKTTSEALSPLVARHDFPASWQIVLMVPQGLRGVAGEEELQIFAELPDIPVSLTAEVCRWTLLGLLPALVDRDCQAFGEALFHIQQHVGKCFTSSQGGTYADRALASIVAFVRSQGVAGVGQSSWGPAMYAVMPSASDARLLAAAVRSRFGLSDSEVQVVDADNEGTTISTSANERPSVPALGH